MASDSDSEMWITQNRFRGAIQEEAFKIEDGFIVAENILEVNNLEEDKNECEAAKPVTTRGIELVSNAVILQTNNSRIPENTKVYQLVG